MCLICGHVGCGRFSNRHAHDHFVETGHTFAYEIESQRVWDYAGDQYVHRLIQNKTDGKLVEVHLCDRWLVMNSKAEAFDYSSPRARRLDQGAQRKALMVLQETKSPRSRQSASNSATCSRPNSTLSGPTMLRKSAN